MLNIDIIIKSVLLSIIIVLIIIIIKTQFKKKLKHECSIKSDMNQEEPEKSINLNISQEKLKSIEEVNIEYKGEIEKLKSEINVKDNRLKILENSKDIEITFKLNEDQKPNITTDVYQAAGPRKDTDSKDSELCEDIVGFKSTSEGVFFWLLDGTSDGSILKFESETKTDILEVPFIFSSRILAKIISDFISKEISLYFKEKKFIELIDHAKLNAIKHFENKLNNDLSDHEKSILIEHLKTGKKPTCSTTLIVGFVSNTGDYFGIRIGDSKLIPFIKNNNNYEYYKEGKFIKDPSIENDRIAIRIDYVDSKFKINTNKLEKYLMDSCKSVNRLILFSDGLSRRFEKLVKDEGNFINAINEISYEPQKTFDDKTLMVITIE